METETHKIKLTPNGLMELKATFPFVSLFPYAIRITHYVSRFTHEIKRCHMESNSHRVVGYPPQLLLDCAQ